MKKEVYGRIYMITNLINDKKYVGLTTKTIEERFKSHLYRANHEKSVVQKAIKKYGKDNFKIEEIDLAYTKESLIEKEIFWIKDKNTLIEGYNLTVGGEGVSQMTEEIKKKISKTKTGSTMPTLKGVPRTKEDRLKISRGLGAKRVKGTHKIFKNEIFYDYPTQAKVDGFNPSLICAVIKGKRPHHKNYIFEYVDDANPDRPIESNNSIEVQRIDTEPTEK